MKDLICKIREYFPSEDIVIRQGYDPEFDRSTEVDLFIQSSDSVDNAFDTIKKFDHEYWLENMDSFRGLNVFIEFTADSSS